MATKFMRKMTTYQKDWVSVPDEEQMWQLVVDGWPGLVVGIPSVERGCPHFQVVCVGEVMWLDRVDFYQDKIILIWIHFCTKNIFSWSVLGLKVCDENLTLECRFGAKWGFTWMWKQLVSSALELVGTWEDLVVQIFLQEIFKNIAKR